MFYGSALCFSGPNNATAQLRLSTVHQFSTKIINLMTKSSGRFSHERSIGTKPGREPLRLKRHSNFHLRQALRH